MSHSGIGGWWIFILCIFSSLVGGVAEDFGHQRNIFPLPDLSHGGCGGSADEAWVQMANSGIKALNELAGCTNSDFGKKRKCTRAQRRCLSNIASSYRDLVLGEVDFDPTNALTELCGSSHVYGDSASVVEPYARERVSWPQVDSQPVELATCLPGADSEWLQAWHTHMLKQQSEVAASVEEPIPYVDPVLKHNKKEYAGFISDLRMRNMVKFKRVDTYGSQLGIFFVKKKSGQLRLIFDTRKLNLKFHEPPHTDLPSADAFGRIGIPDRAEFFVASGDLANAFYTLAVPDSLGRMFTLPPVQASAIGVESIDGFPVQPGSQVIPYLTVLPMGWSWALHLCQLVLDRAIKHAGFSDHFIVSDKGAGVNLKAGPKDGHPHGHVSHSCAAAGYVDNFAVIGLDRVEVDRKLSLISERLRSLGLTVHEEEAAVKTCDFVGLHFNGQTGHISIKPSRILKLRAAIHQLLDMQVCNGKTMQHILGHITWALMCRREGLAILSASYAFVHSAGNRPHRLWPSVRKELIIISDLLPLFRVQINIGWSSEITASDSSPWGIGVCKRQLDVDKVRHIGQCSERWRYRIEDAIKARSFALGSVGARGRLYDESNCDNHVMSEKSGEPYDTDSKLSGNVLNFSLQRGHDAGVVDSVSGNSFETVVSHEIPVEVGNAIQFDPVNPDILHASDWSVVWSAPWKFRANILETEARALNWSVEHLLRANRNIGKHLVCLVDNLPVALAATKGRGKSQLLKGPLRKITSLLLASGSRLHVRWIPSELNIADRPSRAQKQWEAQGLQRWWDSTLGSLPFDNNGKVSRSKRRPTSQSKDEDSEVHDGSGRDDISRIQEREDSNFEGLSTQNRPVFSLVSAAPEGLEVGIRVGSSVSSLPSKSVRSWEGPRRGHQSSSCHQVFHSRGFTTGGEGASTCCPILERLEPRYAAAPEIAYATRGAGGDDGLPTLQRLSSTSPAYVYSICDLHAPWRDQQFDGWAADTTTTFNDQCMSVLGHSPSPARAENPWEDSLVRRIHPLGLRPVDGTFVGQNHSGEKSCRTTLGRSSSTFGATIQPDNQRVGLGRARPVTLCSAPRRSQPRHSGITATSLGGQKEGEVVNRFISEEVCQGSQVATRTQQSESRRGSIRPRSAHRSTKLANDGEVCQSPAKWNSQVTRRLQRSFANFIKQCKHGRISRLSGRELLMRDFRLALKNSKSHSRKVFLDLFAGHQGITKSIFSHGFGCVAVDSDIDPRYDLTDNSILKLIEGWIRGGCISSIWLGTPYATWSRARRGPKNYAWGPLRSSEHIYGFPDLPEPQRAKVRVGNSTMKATARIIRCAVSCGVPVFLENPVSSMLWNSPPINRLSKLRSCRCFVTDFCQHGARWRKRTKVLSWHSQPSPQLEVKCCGRNGVCSLTHKHHIILSGSDPVSKQLWTHLAQPYPARFSHAAASAMIDSAVAREDYVFRCRFGN